LKIKPITETKSQTLEKIRKEYPDSNQPLNLIVIEKVQGLIADY